MNPRGGSDKDRNGKFFSQFPIFTYEAADVLALFLLAMILPEGERYKKSAVHRVVHLCVHLANRATLRRRKSWTRGAANFGRLRGREVGWNDPTFSPLARPKRFSRSFQPILALER